MADFERRDGGDRAMPEPITAEEARARAPVAAMTGLVDIRDWAGLERLFADRVTVDYSSLWGGGAEEMAPAELLGQWRAMLPGFDATRHELGPVSVRVAGDVAEAEAPVSGTHILGGEAWVVAGRYRCRLVRGADGWRIAGLTYENARESGDRGLTERAKARAAAA